MNDLQRTDPAFFNRAETKHVIAEITRSESLVIYVGSGVTLDDTGASWSEMLGRIASLSGVDAARLGRLSAELSSPQMATIVFNAIQGRHAQRAKQELARKLSSLFYEQPDWKNAQFARSVVLLCEEMVKRDKQPIILTTNYDMYLEQRATELEGLGLNAPMELRSYVPASMGDTDSEDEPANPMGIDPLRGQVPVVHLHGYVSSSSAQEFEEQIVFSELDYYRTEDNVFAITEEFFKEHDVLILGSALADAPIVRALARTASEPRGRWAVIPRQGLDRGVDAYAVDKAGESADPLKLLEGRAKALNLKLINPDFFSQAAQFPIEVARAYALAAVGGRYDAAANDYQQRVQAWHSAWMPMAGPNAEDARRRRQAEAHVQLLEAVPTMQRAMQSEMARIKIELWVRDPNNRDLILWASSTGTWPDEEIARHAEIQHGSMHAAVQVFCQGSSQLVDTQGSSERWGRYLGTPVRVGTAEESVTVAVISIAVAKNGVNDNLVRDRRDILGAVIDQLSKLGQQMVAPQPANATEDD